MKILKKSDIKNLIIINTILIICVVISFVIITSFQYKVYNNRVNSVIGTVINNVHEKYPDVKEEDLIKILKSDNDNADLLRKYGFTAEQGYIDSLNDCMKKNIIINIGFIILVFAGLFFVFYRYISNQEKNIRGVNDYLKELNNKNYSLKIEENNEDELSKLKNELYKITILLKETAENSEREKEDLKNSLADISHQLKTPLTSIRIMLDMMTENPDMEKDIKTEFLNDISKQIEWISSLVISILKLAKFDAGVIKMNNEIIDARKLIDEVITNLSILLEIRNIQVVVNSDKNVEFIGDYKWQLEAITNIVKNAIEHSFEDSKIYITIEDNKLYIKIKIRDEGKGIEKKDINHIFERFYREKDSKNNNVGIGLALSKKVIEQNNGFIKVNSEVNKGTIFEIKIFK